MDNSNGILDILKKLLTKQKRLILISSDPNEYKINDDVRNITQEAFNMSGFNFEKVIMIDQRNADKLSILIKEADLIILCGGHVPTQNNWFEKLKLKEILKKYNGIIVGQSAGSMNMAEIVYACPELEGEAKDPNYKRWINGLGLTNINIFPHYEELEVEILDGFKYIDILLKDSFERKIHTLNDGSFIMVNADDITIYGDCYEIYKGIITKICENNNIFKLINSDDND